MRILAGQRARFLHRCRNVPRERDGNDFQVVPPLSTVGVVAGADVGGGAGKKDDAKSRNLVLAVKIIDSLFFGVIGFVAIHDFVEVTPMPAFSIA